MSCHIQGMVASDLDVDVDDFTKEDGQSFCLDWPTFVDMLPHCVDAEMDAMQSEILNSFFCNATADLFGCPTEGAAGPPAAYCLAIMTRYSNLVADEAGLASLFSLDRRGLEACSFSVCFGEPDAWLHGQLVLGRARLVRVRRGSADPRVGDNCAGGFQECRVALADPGVLERGR